MSGIAVAKDDGFMKCGDECEKVFREKGIGGTIITDHDQWTNLVLVVSI